MSPRRRASKHYLQLPGDRQVRGFSEEVLSVVHAAAAGYSREASPELPAADTKPRHPLTVKPAQSRVQPKAAYCCATSAWPKVDMRCKINQPLGLPDPNERAVPIILCTPGLGLLELGFQLHQGSQLSLVRCLVRRIVPPGSILRRLRAWQSR